MFLESGSTSIALFAVRLKFAAFSGDILGCVQFFLLASALGSYEYAAGLFAKFVKM